MIGRIEYTSCEDGIDGIRGFQVRAMTPGIAENLRTAALRDSVYEPPPGAPSMPGPQELPQFPVSFGYTSVAEGTALYQATYVGRDHTGRWGNYFAQAVTIGSGEAGPQLPIDLWDSPIWRPTSDRAGVLDRVDPAELLPGRSASTAATVEFLNQDERHQTLSAVVAMVRGLLNSGRGRLVLVVDDSTSAALWISAVTRSLPQPMAWAVSFTTFTSRPESHSALLAFATPDVSIPTYGNYRSVDLRGASIALDAEVSDYDQVIAQLWLTEDPSRLMHRASTLAPPLAESELDAFVGGALLFEVFPTAIEWSEAKVVAGLAFVLRRMPAVALQPWDKVAAAAREMGELRDVASWSQLLREASTRRAPIPRPLLQSYVKAAVQAIVNGQAGPSLWLPSLDPTAQHDLAATYLAPTLWRHSSPSLPTWLLQPENGELREATLDVLAGYVEPPVVFEEAIAALTTTTAESMGRLVTARPRLRLAIDTVLAGAERMDPVEILVNLRPEALRSADEPARLAALLWPAAPPTIQQGMALLRALPSDRLDELGLIDDHLVQRLLEDCDQGLTAEDFRLAREISNLVQQHRHLVSESNRPLVDLVSITGYLRGHPPYEQAIDQTIYGVRMRAGVAATLADEFNAAVVGWVLSLDWDQQQQALRKVVAQDAAHLGVRYAEAAEVELATAKPERVAELITAWRQLGAASKGSGHSAGTVAAIGLSVELLEKVLPLGLKRFNTRVLERLGDLEILRVHASLPNDDFALWWAKWQQRHERPGLLSRFKRPRAGDGR